MLAVSIVIGIAAVIVVAIVLLTVARLAVTRQEASAVESCARLLLRDVLSDAEYRQFTADGYLAVRSPSVEHREYHVPRSGGRVAMYERGRLVCELCLRSTRPLPASDTIVLHKLLIVGDEAGYLATANHFMPTRQGLCTLPV